MYIYLIINCLIFLSSFFYENSIITFRYKKESCEILYKFWCIILIFLSIFRYGIGTDYWTYYKRYLDISSLKVNDGIFAFVLRFLRQCHLPYQLFIILCSLLFLIPTMYLIRQLNNNYKLFSLGILLGFSFYVYSYNIFRQYAAMALMLLFIFKYTVTNKKKFLYYLVLPITIHPSSLIVIVLYFIIIKTNLRIRKLQVISFVGIGVFFIVPNSFATYIIRKTFSILKYTMYSGYVLSKDTSFLARIYNQSMEFIPKVLIVPMLIILPLFINRINYYLRNEENEFIMKKFKVQKIFVKVYFAYFLVMSLKIGSEIISRFLMYFSILGVIVIPMLFTYFNDTKMKKIINSLFAIFIIIVSVYMQIKWLNNNGCEAYPYCSIFGLI